MIHEPPPIVSKYIAPGATSHPVRGPHLPRNHPPGSPPIVSTYIHSARCHLTSCACPSLTPEPPPRVPTDIYVHSAWCHLILFLALTPPGIIHPPGNHGGAGRACCALARCDCPELVPRGGGRGGPPAGGPRLCGKVAVAAEVEVEV